MSVRIDAVEKFHEYERLAATVMTRHGGRIERTVVIPPIPGEGILKEVHIVLFPGESAYQAYRADDEFAAAAHLREESVVATEILIGHDGPAYHDGK